MLNTALAAVAEVSSLDALRAISDSQRHRILTMLIREPLSAAQIAKKLKIPRTRVYYHLDLLQEHRFIRVVDERHVSAMVERTFRASAHRFRVDRRMLAAASSESEVNEAQAALLERTADDLRAHRDIEPAAAESDVLVVRSFFKSTPARVAELRAALIALVDRYAEDASGDPYEMTFALFRTSEDNA
jgi:predicted ArsR family transcriptional regulator